MAVKASGHITLYSVVDVQATYRYYLLQSSTLTKPSIPTTNPPNESWHDSEPSYTSGSTNSLYYVDLTEFSNGSFAYSEVSLSSSYEAAKEAYNKAVTAQGTANNAQEDINNLEIGAINLLRNTNLEDYWNEWIPWQTSILEFADGYLKITPDSESTSCGAYPPRLTSLENGIEYTVSFVAYAEEDVSVNYCYIMADEGNTSLGVVMPVTTTPARYSYTFTTSKEHTNASIMLGYSYTNDSPVILYIKELKLEEGNRATDWSPAPEDVRNEISSAQNAADSAQNTANENSSRLNGAWLEIDAINATIQNLVRGQNGETLMTQTETGWTFDFSSIQETLNIATANIDDLNGKSTLTDTQIEQLKQSVTDLGVYTEYIEFGVDNGQPCIILGEHDSTFKVVITNTDIRFMEGENIPAYISNQSLNIQKAVISQELRQGEFVWMARSNGNYGLLWRGE